jgi:GMP synthase-like glutamine amidotransferase
MRIGILQADSVLPQFQDIHGDYPAMFVRLLSEPAGDVTFCHYDVTRCEYPSKMGDCDGYLITGSRRSVYDDEPWISALGAFVVRLHEAEVPTIGICFGHQLIAHVLGGKTARADVGWGVGIHRCLVYEQREFMLPGAATVGLIVSHQDQVKTLPEGSRLLAGSDFCPIAMFEFGSMLGIQGHPEFDRRYSRDLMDMRQETLGPNKYRAGVASLMDSPDSDLLGRWMVQFIKAQLQADGPANAVNQ